jgi:hypothetical protein
MSSASMTRQGSRDMVGLTKTWQAARRAHELLQRKKAERDPLVLAVLEKFPGAEIVSVKEIDDGCDRGDRR